MRETRTKTAIAASRDASYRIPSGLFCATCKHGWFHWGKNHNGQCHLVEIRGKLIVKSVSMFGTCAEHEEKDST